MCASALVCLCGGIVDLFRLLTSRSIPVLCAVPKIQVSLTGYIVRMVDSDANIRQMLQDEDASKIDS